MSLDLFDIVIVPKNNSQRVSEEGVRAFINYVHATGLAKATDEVCSEHWTEVYFTTAFGSHGIFYDGELREGAPPFQEFRVRFGAESLDPGYPGVASVFVLFEFRGTPFECVKAELPARIDDIFYIRPEMHARPHQPIESRPGQEGVALNKRLKRKDRASKQVGTRIEEL